MSKEKVVAILLDAQENAFFARELETIKSQTYDIKYPELKSRLLFPISREAGAGAKNITYRQYDMVGMAKIISNYADDLPRASVKGKEFTSPVKELGSSYGYSWKDIQSSAMAGKSLDKREAEAARRAIAQQEDSIAFSGDADTGLPGFFTNPNIISVTLTADGSGGATTFASKTPAQIIRDMSAVCNAPRIQTFGVESTDTLLLPIEQHAHVSQTRCSDNSDTTILEFFLKANPQIQSVVDWYRLDGAGTAGADVMVAYKRNPMNLTMEVAMDFLQMPVQERNLEYVVNCIESFGGVIIYYPLSVAKAEGI